MDDLISREAALEVIEAVKNFSWSQSGKVLCGKMFSQIKDLPAVDAAPIIRCASCKWWNGSTLGVAHRCAALHIATMGEFYCATAERKCNAFADQSGAEYADNPTV
jgi:hypothetical protein